VKRVYLKYINNDVRKMVKWEALSFWHPSTHTIGKKEREKHRGGEGKCWEPTGVLNKL
jgi:hypothetical protein